MFCSCCALWLVISPEMTCETSQMSVPSIRAVSTSQNPKAKIDKNWHVYSVGHRTNLLGSGILISASALHGTTSNLARSG